MLLVVGRGQSAHTSLFDNNMNDSQFIRTLLQRKVTDFEDARPSLSPIPLAFESSDAYGQTFMPFVEEESRVGIADAIRSVGLRPESVAVPIAEMRTSVDGVFVSVKNIGAFPPALQDRELRYGDLVVLSNVNNGLFVTDQGAPNGCWTHLFGSGAGIGCGAAAIEARTRETRQGRSSHDWTASRPDAACGIGRDATVVPQLARIGHFAASRDGSP